MSKSKICVVGIGSWGFNHIKTLNELDVEISCVDENIDQIKKIKTIYPNIEHYSSLEKIISKQSQRLYHIDSSKNAF